MDSIFSHAAFVLVWLGAEADDSRLAVQSMANHPRSGGWLSCTHCEGPAEEPIAQFIARPYWSRIWVIQEFLLARHVLLLCGSERLGWSELMAWYDAHDGDLPPQFAMPGDNFNNLVRRRAAKLEMETQRHRLFGREFTPVFRAASLTSLLNKFWGLKCSDKRDAVYGLLSLAATEIKPDYTKTTAELYLEVLETERRRFWGEEWKWRSFRLNLQMVLGIDGKTGELLESRGHAGAVSTA